MHGLWGSSPCSVEWVPPWALQVGTSLWELRVGGRLLRHQDHGAAHPGTVPLQVEELGHDLFVGGRGAEFVQLAGH